MQKTNVVMSEELRHSFEAIFGELVDVRCGVDGIVQPANQTVSLADGVRIQCCFHYAIRYVLEGEEYILGFRYVDSKDLVSKQTCHVWAYMTEILHFSIRVCLVSDKGFESSAFEYVQSRYSTLCGRLVLAKYNGESSSALVLNRQWSDYHDKRNRTGVLTSTAPCSGAVFSDVDTLLSPVGLLRKLHIPVKEEYIFRCPPLTQEWIDDAVACLLAKMSFTEREFLETEYLLTIADSAGLSVSEVEMSEDFFGEYSYSEDMIRLNNRYCVADVRKRFTLAHELGHHFLHRALLERQNYKVLDDQETIEIVGSSSEDSQRFESQANYYASCLLLPREMTIRYALSWMEDAGIRKGYVYEDGQYSQSEGSFNRKKASEFIGSVSSHFRVSKSAARYRLQHLKLLRVEPSFATPKLFI